MTTPHTPTPLFVDFMLSEVCYGEGDRTRCQEVLVPKICDERGRAIFDGSNSEVMEIDDSDPESPPRDVRGFAEAAFIVLAANAHADLVAALGVLLDYVDYTRNSCKPTDMVSAVLPMIIISQARAALSKANGGAS